MTIVLVMGLCNFLLYKARIGHENTYDMCEKNAIFFVFNFD